MNQQADSGAENPQKGTDEGFLSTKGIISLSGAATVVWILTSVFTQLLAPTGINLPEIFLAFILAQIVSFSIFLGIQKIEKKGFVRVAMAFFNGCLILSSALGINTASTSSVSENTSEAGFLPFLEEKPWMIPTGISETINSLQSDVYELNEVTLNQEQIIFEQESEVKLLSTMNNILLDGSATLMDKDIVSGTEYLYQPDQGSFEREVIDLIVVEIGVRRYDLEINRMDNYKDELENRINDLENHRRNLSTRELEIQKRLEQDPQGAEEEELRVELREINNESARVGEAINASKEEQSVLVERKSSLTVQSRNMQMAQEEQSSEIKEKIRRR